MAVVHYKESVTVCCDWTEQHDRDCISIPPSLILCLCFTALPLPLTAHFELHQGGKPKLGRFTCLAFWKGFQLFKALVFLPACLLPCLCILYAVRSASQSPSLLYYSLPPTLSVSSVLLTLSLPRSFHPQHAPRLQTNTLGSHLFVKHFIAFWVVFLSVYLLAWLPFTLPCKICYAFRSVPIASLLYFFFVCLIVWLPQCL